MSRAAWVPVRSDEAHHTMQCGEGSERVLRASQILVTSFARGADVPPLVPP